MDPQTYLEIAKQGEQAVELSEAIAYVLILGAHVLVGAIVMRLYIFLGNVNKILKKKAQERHHDDQGCCR